MMTTERAVPENTIEMIDAEIFPPETTAFDPDALLTEQLKRCHASLLECFDCGSNGHLPMSTQMDALKLAAKLIKTSMALAAAIKGPARSNEFRRHVVIEHIVKTIPTPSPNTKIRKTNSGADQIGSHDG